MSLREIALLLVIAFLLWRFAIALAEIRQIARAAEAQRERYAVALAAAQTQAEHDKIMTALMRDDRLD